MGFSLGLERKVLEQSFDAFQPVVALDGKMQRLALQSVVAAVEKGNHRLRFAEMAPRGLNEEALPSGLLPGRSGSAAPFAKRS